VKNILVPIDFSAASFNALSYAAFIANIFNARLTIVHAYTSTSAYDESADAKVHNSRDELESANQKFLKREINGIARKFTIKIKGIVQKGQPVKVINEVADALKADLIVLGMKGKGESNSWLGSTTTAMIAKTSVPLLVIPKDASYQTIETMTLASDFEDGKLLSNFPLLEMLIAKYDPFVHILNVQRNDSKLTHEMIAAKMTGGLIWEKYNHAFNIIVEDDIDEGINKFLKKNKSDLLIMVARKRNFIAQIMDPSHTKKMTYQTKIPLLIFHKV
jgi:nucleotide-binding universal stress UspA family protein